ncbi:MAG: hypothetical protein ACYTG0_20800 [Planctomycetota bacterium]|jgi:hypothetical protein
MHRLAVQHEIFLRLAPVRKGLRKRAVMRSCGRGLLGGSAIAIALGLAGVALLVTPTGALVRSIAGRGVAAIVLSSAAALALLVPPVLAAWLAALRRPSWRAAAAAVDGHYRLQDRVATALDFLQKRDRTPWEELQIADAVRHLGDVNPTTALPTGLPKPLPVAMLLAAVAACAVGAPLLLATQDGIDGGGKTAGSPILTGPTSQPAPTGRAGLNEPRPMTVDPSQNVIGRNEPVAGPIGWQQAPPGEVAVGKVHLGSGQSFRESVKAAIEAIASGRTKTLEPPDEANWAKPIETVVAPERLPLEYRRLARLYLESIRPNDFATPDQPER